MNAIGKISFFMMLAMSLLVAFFGITTLSLLFLVLWCVIFVLSSDIKIIDKDDESF